MGIRIQKVTYISDRGQEFEIDEMQSSHLMNAIHHHQKQIGVIADLLFNEVWSPDDEQTKNLRERQDHLIETVNQLATELANRSLEDDAKREEGGYTRGHDRW
jgi:hypothetical protein